MKQKRTIFSQLMFEYAVIILLCVSSLYTMFYITLRDVQINNRIKQITTHANDIARLFSAEIIPVQNSSIPEVFFQRQKSITQILEEKIKELYTEYDAYCLVVDEYGKVSAFFLSIIDEHNELKANFDTQNIVKTLSGVLEGKEVNATIRTISGPMFTVAVPLKYEGKVTGAVYIQTAAQNIHHAYFGMAMTTGLVAINILLLSALIAWYLNKRLTMPLKELSNAAAKISGGEFVINLKEDSTKEINNLSTAFNQMSQQLERIDKTRRDFLANVSHELRSPMTNIQGFVQGLLDGTISKYESDKYLSIVLDETKRLTKLVNSLLNLSKIESNDGNPSPTAFDINELIRQVIIPNIGRIEEKKHNFELCIEDNSTFVYADRDLIEQVLINLIDNAIKYTPDCGHIFIISRVVDGKVHVSVEDDGIGISNDDLPYVFDRFYMAEKAHTNGKGTGLGLAISKKIIDRHRETMSVRSSLGSGSKFEFTLPLCNKKGEQNGN